MNIIKLTVILLITSMALSFICSEKSFNPATILPFCDGEPINAYHWGGLAVCVITAWGYYRLKKHSDDE